MRVVLSTFGSNGDVQPMLALAAELGRAGHQRVLALSPNFAERASDNGIEFVQLGPALPQEKIRSIISAQMANQKPAEQVRHFLEATLPVLPEMCQTLREACRNADVLVGSPFHIACRIVHETTGIPYVSVHLSQFADLGGCDMREVSAALINPYRIQEGLPAVSDPLGADANSGQLAIYAVSRHFLQRPAKWPEHYKVVGFFFHDEKEWRPDHGLEAFCSSGDRPVIVNFGSMVHSDPAAITDLVLDAARQAGCRMVIQQGWSGLGKEQLPANVYVTGFAPHAWLFPKASLIVHHGGAGTTASTLRAGVPAVVVPHILDQPIWAEFARAQGCARNVIPFSHLNASRLAAAIRNALASPHLYQAAASFGEQIRAETGVQTARKLIEDLVANQQRPVDVVVEKKPAKIELVRQPEPAAVPRQEIPLSYAQQRLWFADQLEQGSTAYNMPFLWRFEGDLHPSALQRAIDQVVERHEILRTTFPVCNGRPVQKISPKLKIMLEEIDLRGLVPEEREAGLKRIANEEAARHFNLEQGPLWSMKWLRLDTRSHVLIGNMHHIVSDGWSQEIMSREVSQLYEAYVQNKSVELQSLSTQYADYAVWQREQSGEALEKQLAYWRKQLAGLPVLQLPTDYPRPAIKSHRGGSAKYHFSDELAGKLKSLARREGVTFFMLVLAAFQILLSKYAGQEDLAVGTPIAGRTRKELEGLIGCFINMLALRADFRGNPSFREAIRRARNTALEAYQYQDVPFEKIVQELQTDRDVSRTPLFQVMLAFQNIQLVRPQLHGLQFTGSIELVESAPFDLTLEMIESHGTFCRLWYARDLYTAETAERMLRHFNRILETMVATPELKIADFTLLTDAEARQVLVEWNNTAGAYSREHCMHEVFEQVASRQPAALAAEYEGQTLTYHELNCQANQMARYLRKLGVGPEVPVAVCMERRLEQVIGLLGVLKAGGAYVALDHCLPKERIRWMLNDLGSPVVLTQAEIAEKLELGGHVVCVDNPHIQEALEQEQQTNLGPLAQVSNAVYISYTSGSTGKPKAVVVTHGGLVNLAQFQQRFFGVTAQDRVLQFVAPSFDPAIGDCFTGWVSGAAVVLGPDPRQTLGRDLARLMQTLRITYTGITPSMLMSIPPDAEFPELRVLLTGGAQCPEDVMCRWSKGRRMFNVYGPTETTICAVSTQLSSADGSVSIGRPIANAHVYVLDKDMNPVPVGMNGELYIGGVGLTRGYWKRPDLTADRFVPNAFSVSGGERLYRTGDIVRWRPDQKLEFVGRADEQIKIREQRIELGEIEAALRERKDIKDALVIAREDQPGDKRLVAYVVPKETGSEELLPGELRAALRERLPAYMVPSHFVMMSEFPVNVSGKIDRRELPVPAEPKTRPGPVATDALTEIEQKIAAVWSDILQVERVSVHDNFFDLGGDSFKSIRVQSELIKVLGREIKVLELFRFPTIRTLAEYLAQQASGSSPAKDAPRPLSLDGGKERLKRQLAQRTASKGRGAPVVAP